MPSSSSPCGALGLCGRAVFAGVGTACNSWRHAAEVSVQPRSLCRIKPADAMLLEARRCAAANVRNAAVALDAERRVFGDLVPDLPAVEEGNALLVVLPERLLEKRVQRTFQLARARSEPPLLDR